MLMSASSTSNFEENGPGQVALVLQGGGALGAYQGGVYQALHESEVEPDWLVGTSIGAINASLIAGNAPEHRLSALRTFWDRVEHDGSAFPACVFQGNPYASADNVATILSGVPGFFEPNLTNIYGDPKARIAIDHTSYYSIAPLKKTLLELVDPERFKSERPRITVGAANVRLGIMHYFDSLNMPLGIQHILASGALPPAFPPVEVDGEYFWDGGVLSNTPIEAVFDDMKRRSGLIFTVQVWNQRGEHPRSILQVFNREKDMQYASRTESQIMRQKQIHKLRHVISELANHLPDEMRKNGAVDELCSYGCLTQMHVVLLQAPALAQETYLKDIDFTTKGIRARWDAGYRDTKQALEQAPWLKACDPHEGVIVHYFPPGTGED